MQGAGISLGGISVSMAGLGLAIMKRYSSAPYEPNSLLHHCMPDQHLTFPVAMLY